MTLLHSQKIDQGRHLASRLNQHDAHMGKYEGEEGGGVALEVRPIASTKPDRYLVLRLNTPRSFRLN